MYRRRRFNRKRKYRRRSKKTYFQKRGTFAKKVKKVIFREAETKETNAVVMVSVPVAKGSSGVMPQSIPLLPYLAAASNRYSRIGNNIKLSKSTISGIISLTPTMQGNTQAYSPVTIVMWLVTYKAIKEQFSTLNSTINTNFMVSAQASKGLAGDMTDMFYPIDENTWTVHAKKIMRLSASSWSRLTNNYVSTTVSGTETGNLAGASNFYENGKVSKSFSIRIDKYIKNLRFNDTQNAAYPINTNLHLILQALPGDGSLITAGNVLADLDSVIHWRWKDI